jgi:hypothetical protein
LGLTNLKDLAKAQDAHSYASSNTISKPHWFFVRKLTIICDPGIQKSHGNTHLKQGRGRYISTLARNKINNHTDNVTTRMTTSNLKKLTRLMRREPKSSTKKTERVKYYRRRIITTTQQLDIPLKEHQR